MAKPMKFYLAQVEEANGKYEYSTTILITAKSLAGATQTLTYVCRHWYCDGDGIQVTDYKYYYNCGDVAVWEGACVEINEQTFKDCSRMLNSWGLSLKGELNAQTWKDRTAN